MPLLARVPKKILKCRAVSREITFESAVRRMIKASKSVLAQANSSSNA